MSQPEQALLGVAVLHCKVPRISLRLRQRAPDSKDGTLNRVHAGVVQAVVCVLPKLVLI
jgi:hypothetical protein